MTASVNKGDVTFTGAVDMSDATVTMPTAIAASDNVTWSGTHNFDGAVDMDSTVDLSGATVTYPSAQISPAALLSTAVAPAADAACAILNTTTEITLTVTAAGNVAISTTSSVAGQVIYIRAAAVAGGGSYTLAVTGGTLTFNSTGEAAIIRRNTANSAWLVYSLCPSSSTAANIATIV